MYIKNKKTISKILHESKTIWIDKKEWENINGH